MNLLQTAILGAIAGFTIFLGLPIGRIQHVSDRARAFLTMTSAGILVFLFWDIFSNIHAPVEAALDKVMAGEMPSSQFLLYAAVLVAGFAIGLLGLVAFESRLMRREPGQPINSRRLAIMIAAGLGLHNFSEGLAIGQSSANGELALAGLLIIGFGLHNATEGFGIVGPLAGTRPSWGFLALAGLIGGGPTFLGTILGYSFVSTALGILFLALAAGAILYVIGELFNVSRRIGYKYFAMSGLLVGFLLGYATDLILKIAGA